MSVDDIMKSITAGLTGDAQKDIQFLRDQIAFRSRQENGREIEQECNRLIFALLPDDAKDRFTSLMNRDAKTWHGIISEADLNMSHHNVDQVIQILEPLVSDLYQLEQFFYLDDSQTEYHNFTELFEELLYRELSHSELDFKPVPIPFCALYSRYSSALFEEDRCGDAAECLEKALRWNPVDTNLMFEYAECHKATGNLDRFYQITLGACEVAFRPESLARCYRNLAYFFAEKEQWDVGASCIFMSQQYDPESEIARNELEYIEHSSGKPVSDQSFLKFQQYCSRYNLPMGASDAVLGTAYSYGHYFLQSGRNDIAKYLLTIFYNLTYNEEVKAILDGLQ